jgi:predicted Zn-dependent peptidase
MTRRTPMSTRSAGTVALVLALGAAPAAARVPAFEAPRPIERTLENGLRVVVVPRDQLPLVQISLAVPAGSVADPAGQEGVAALTAQMLRRGTTSRTAEDFAAAVERLGGVVTSSATREASVLSGVFLARDLEAGLELLSDATVSPSFDPREFELARAAATRAVLQTQGLPPALGDEHAWAAALAGHPYGRSPLGTTRSLAGLSRDAVRAFHRDRWRPDRAVLAIAGQVDPERAFALARDWFSRWAGISLAAPAVPAAVPTPSPRVTLVDMPGLAASEIRLALVLPGRTAAQVDAAALAASAFAGAAGSRLADAVPPWGGGGAPRTGVTTLRDGALLLVAVTAPADSAATIAGRLRAALRRFAERPPTEAELAPLRRALVRGAPMGFESLGGLLAQWQTARFDGTPDDSLLASARRLAAVRAPDVAAVARQWFDPSRASLVVVAPAQRVQRALATLGPVERVQPETQVAAGAPADTLAAATPERIERGRQIVRRALEAHGGVQRLRGIVDSRVSGEVVFSMGGRELPGTFEMVRREPFQLQYVTRLLTYETRQVLNGSRGWMQAAADAAPKDADSLEVAGLRSAFLSDVPHLLLAAADSATTLVWRGREPVGSVECDAVEVVAAGKERRRYHFDPADGRLAAIDLFDSAEPAASRVARRTYGDYRPVDGVSWPFREERSTAGDNAMRMEVKSVRLNAGVPDVTFLRPAPGVTPDR